MQALCSCHFCRRSRASSLAYRKGGASGTSFHSVPQVRHFTPTSIGAMLGEDLRSVYDHSMDAETASMDSITSTGTPRGGRGMAPPRTESVVAICGLNPFPGEGGSNSRVPSTVPQRGHLNSRQAWCHLASCCSRSASRRSFLLSTPFPHSLIYSARGAVMPLHFPARSQALAANPCLGSGHFVPYNVSASVLTDLTQSAKPP